MDEKIYLGVLEENSKTYYVVACKLPAQIGKLHTEENQILLDPVYDRVSRVHGVIESVPGRGYFYLDRSSNGTRVGELVLRNARTALSPGFELRIGNYIITHIQQAPLLVVHTDRKLVIQAQINPTDADDVYQGQKTQVRFLSVHDRTLPMLEGTVRTISADRLKDEKSGLSYFVAEVEVSPAELNKVRAVLGQGQLRPGLPVEVVLAARKRTALQYILEPLTANFWRSLREQ